MAGGALRAPAIIYTAAQSDAVRENVTMIGDNKVDPTSFLARRVIPAGISIAVSQTSRPFFRYKPGFNFELRRALLENLVLAGNVSVDAMIGSNDECFVAGALAIDGNPVKFQLGLSRYAIGGLVFEKAAATAIVFSAAHVVTAAKYGAILVQISNAGVVSSKITGATQTTAMAYTTLAAAIAALPVADAGKRAIGYITVLAGVGDWTANTSNMTNGSGATTVVFNTNAATVTSALGAAIIAVTGTVVEGVLNSDQTTVRGDRHQTLYLFYTSDGAGALTNGHCIVEISARRLAGQGS